MDAVLPKPFSEYALVNLLSLVLSNNGSMEVMGGEIKYYDLELLNEMSVGNEEFIPKMLGLFLNQTPGLLREMKEAIGQHDLVRLSKLGHKMKSMISTLGISEVKDDIKILEKAVSLNASPAQIEQSFRKLETILGIVFSQLSLEISNY